MNKLKLICRRIVCVLLIGSMLLLSGCRKDIKLSTGLADDEIFRIDNQKEKLAEIMVLLMNEKNKYEKNFGEDIWTKDFDGASLEDEVKEKVKQQMIELNMIYLMAEKDKVSCDVKEKDVLNKAADAYFATLSEEEKSVLGISRDHILDLYEKMYVTDKYYDIKTADETWEISDEEAKVIEVLYIYFKSGDADIHGNIIPYEDAVIQEIKAEATAVMQRIQQGEDMQSLAVTYSDDEEYRSVFGRGQMEEYFENAAYALKEGEVSALVEAEDGFYIIKCVDDYLEAETQEHKKNLEKQYRAEKFQEIYEPFIEGKTLEFHNKIWDEIRIENYLNCDTDSFYATYEEYIPLMEEEGTETLSMK